MGPEMPCDDKQYAEIAVISQQIKTLVEAVQRTEKQLEKLDPINATVGEMRISLALKADQQALNAVDAKVAGWVGHFRGALTVATLALSVVQVVLVGGVGYVFTHLQANETAVAVQTSRLDDLQKTMRAQPGKTEWAISTKRFKSSSALRRDM